MHYWHMSPDTFWKMTSTEYWAAMRAANPELYNELNTSSELFTEEEKEELAEMLRKYG